MSDCWGELSVGVVVIADRLKGQGLRPGGQNLHVHPSSQVHQVPRVTL